MDGQAERWSFYKPPAFSVRLRMTSAALIFTAAGVRFDHDFHQLIHRKAVIDRMRLPFGRPFGLPEWPRLNWKGFR